MGKSFAHDAIIGQCLHSHGSDAFTYMATVLKYFYQGDSLLLVVRDCVNPEAKIIFSECLRKLSAVCAKAELPSPVAFSSEFVSDWGLELRGLRDTDEAGGRAQMHSWVRSGVQKLRQALFPHPSVFYSS